MSLLGTGRIAAITLRQRILERLGAEPEWNTGDPGDNVIGWMASPLTTFLQVEDGPDHAPNLAVLRVMTPTVPHCLPWTGSRTPRMGPWLVAEWQARP